MIVGFVIATLVKHYELEVNALMVMSTHYHVRFHDPHGNASNYSRDAHSMIARLIIWAFGDDDETLWAPLKNNILEDEMPEGGIDQIGYIMAQPVAAGDVEAVDDWPGVFGRWPNQDQSFPQPRGFFQDDKWFPEKLTCAGNSAIHWAESATLTFTRPRGYDDLSDSDLADAIDDVVKKFVAEAHEKWGPNHEYPGKAACTKMSRRKRATSKEPKRGAKRVPTIRSSDPERRVERLGGLSEWRRNYKACRLEFRTNRDVVFPMGTNKMKVDLDVNVDAAPT